MRGSLSPSVLAKNKRNAVFRLVSVRTDFSSEKLFCTRPTSEGSCFAKQSEQRLTKPLLSQAKLARACPSSDLYCLENYFDFLQPLHSSLYHSRKECFTPFSFKAKIVCLETFSVERNIFFSIKGFVFFSSAINFFVSRRLELVVPSVWQVEQVSVNLQAH